MIEKFVLIALRVFMIEKLVLLVLICTGIIFIKSVEQDFKRQSKLIEQLYRRIYDLEEENRRSCSYVDIRSMKKKQFTNSNF